MVIYDNILVHFLRILNTKSTISQKLTIAKIGNLFFHRFQNIGHLLGQKWPIFLSQKMRDVLKPMKNNYSIFSFWDMVDFELDILRKFNKMSPYMTKLLNFATILLAARSKCISEDSKEMKKKLSRIFIRKFFFCSK